MVMDERGPGVWLEVGVSGLEDLWGGGWCGEIEDWGGGVIGIG